MQLALFPALWLGLDPSPVGLAANTAPDMLGTSMAETVRAKSSFLMTPLLVIKIASVFRTTWGCQVLVFYNRVLRGHTFKLGHYPGLQSAISDRSDESSPISYAASAPSIWAVVLAPMIGAVTTGSVITQAIARLAM